MLDKVANEYAGIRNEEKPVIGMRGQSKDLSRIAGLIRDKRRKARLSGDPNAVAENKPLTMILLDDKNQDAYAQCQVGLKGVCIHAHSCQAIIGLLS